MGAIWAGCRGHAPDEGERGQPSGLLEHTMPAAKHERVEEQRVTVDESGAVQGADNSALPMIAIFGPGFRLRLRPAEGVGADDLYRIGLAVFCPGG